MCPCLLWQRVLKLSVMITLLPAIKLWVGWNHGKFVWLSTNKWPPQYSKKKKKISSLHHLIASLPHYLYLSCFKKVTEYIWGQVLLEPKGDWRANACSFKYAEEFGEEKAIRLLWLCLIYTSKSPFYCIPCSTRGVKSFIKIKLIIFQQRSQWKREFHMTVWVSYQPIQWTLLISSTYECTVGINVLYAYASWPLKWQRGVS